MCPKRERGQSVASLAGECLLYIRRRAAVSERYEILVNVVEDATLSGQTTGVKEEWRCLIVKRAMA